MIFKVKSEMRYNVVLNIVSVCADLSVFKNN